MSGTASRMNHVGMSRQTAPTMTQKTYATRTRVAVLTSPPSSELRVQFARQRRTFGALRACSFARARRVPEIGVAETQRRRDEGFGALRARSFARALRVPEIGVAET